MRFLGAPDEDSRFWQEHLLRSMARTVGEFGIPEDAAHSNHEAEERLAEVIAPPPARRSPPAPRPTPPT